jgi:isocitrate lyase
MMFRSVARRLPRHRFSTPLPATSRFLSAARVNMAASLPSVDPPVSTALPSDAYQLLPESAKTGAAEDALFEQQVSDVKQWWASERYQGIKRPYSAEDVVGKRGALQQIYPSSLMARKLFNLFRDRAAKGEPVHTSV